MKTNRAIAVTLIAASAFLTGCASPNRTAVSSPYPSSTSSVSSAYGVVDSIQVVQGSSGSTGTMGSVAGGVVGGLLGNQVGEGRGRTAATVAGAVGGAMVGNSMEKNMQGQAGQAYQIGIRMDNGSYQTIQQDTIADLGVGSRVRIENGRVFRY